MDTKDQKIMDLMPENIRLLIIEEVKELLADELKEEEKEKEEKEKNRVIKAIEGWASRANSKSKNE